MTLEIEAYNNYKTTRILFSYTIASLRDYFKHEEKNYLIDRDKQIRYLPETFLFSKTSSNNYNTKKKGKRRRVGTNIKHHLAMNLLLRVKCFLMIGEGYMMYE